ncbi:C-X-C chemokine receptor type 6-like [Mantella aurantiaca]
MDHQNSTYDENHYISSPIHDLMLPIIYCLTFAVGLTGNVLVIVVFAFYEKKKTLTDSFLLNLAVADIFFVCMLPFLVCQMLHKWIFGEIMCKIVIGMYRVNLYTSMLTLTAITFDRFVSIVKVAKTQRYQQHKHRWGGCICAFIWMNALLLAVPQFKFSVDQGNWCAEDYIDRNLEITIHSFQLAIGFLLPLAAMVFCYSFILNTLIRSKSLQKRKSIRIILTLVLVFILTQLPFNVTLLVFLKRKDDLVLAYVMAALEGVAIVHACLNPFLYFFVGSKFRKSFFKLLRDCRLAKEQDEPSRETEGSSKVVSASTHMEAFSILQT